MWKRALMAVVLVLATLPALASDQKPGPVLVASAVSASEVSRATAAAADISGLVARVESLEERIDRLGATPRSERQRAAVAKVRDAEFLGHVWTDP